MKKQSRAVFHISYVSSTQSNFLATSYQILNFVQYGVNVKHSTWKFCSIKNTPTLCKIENN